MSDHPPHPSAGLQLSTKILLISQKFLYPLIFLLSYFPLTDSHMAPWYQFSLSTVVLGIEPALYGALFFPLSTVLNRSILNTLISIYDFSLTATGLQLGYNQSGLSSFGVQTTHTGC